MNVLNSRTEERISEQGDRTTRIKLFKQQRENGLEKKKEHSSRDPCDYNKRCNIHVIQIWGREEKDFPNKAHTI